MLRLLAVTAVLLLPLAGAKTEQPPAFESTVEPALVDTTLYLHLLSPQDMPISTLEPRFSGSWWAEETGVTASTLTCANKIPAATGGSFAQDWHTYYGYSTPSMIDYEAGADGSPRVHRTRGLGYDVPLDRSSPAILHWFMAEASGVPVADAERAAMVNVVVQAVVSEPIFMSVDDPGYGTGTVLMQGSTLPVTATNGEVVGDGSTQVSASQVDGRWVYDFAVPLALEGEEFNATAGYNLQIEVRMETEACSEGNAMPATAAAFADPMHLPRIEVRTAEPLAVLNATAADLGDGTVLLRWNVQSGWGNYDIDVLDAALEVFGPDGAVDVRFESAVQRMHEHYHFMDPYEGTWTVAGLADGTYTAIFKAPNLQDTAAAEARVTFHVQGGRVVAEEPAEVPGVGLLPLLGLLAIAVIVRRRS